MTTPAVTYSPCLKAGASTLSATAKANLRLIVAPVAQRCPAVFDVNYGIMIEVGFLRLVPRTSTFPYYTLFQQKKYKTDVLYPHA